MKDWLKRYPAAFQLLLGITALCAGVAVYALDRPPGSVGFLPHGLVRDGGFFGLLAGSLPTFLHVMAFALITAALLAPTWRARFVACAAWAAINLAFEAAQHPAFAKTVGFGMNGAFDPHDMLAALLGAAAAIFLMWAATPARRTQV